MLPQKAALRPGWNFLNLRKGSRDPVRAIAHRTVSACLLCLFLIFCETVIADDRSNEKTSPTTGKKLVFFGFQPALDLGDEGNSVQSPLSGAVFEAEPVGENIARDLTDEFYKQLIKKREGHTISPDQARGVFYVIIDRASVSTDKEIMPQMGRALSAKAVLAGYVYRWRERQGSGLAVDRPASVAFDLCLIDSDTARLLWKGRFDKTQRSLSENIFDVRTFLEGRGKWMTAKDLAKIGLGQLLDKFEQYEKGERK